jgi:eukaryotic-like serine/threonine-protein kinase
MLNAQTQLGPYRVIAQIGAGGMGEVYRATDTRLGREVAIKVLPPSFGNDADRLRRFEQEARATGILNHPNILSIFDVGKHDGAPFVVSELLEGETLREKIAGAKLPLRRAIDYAEQLADGLAAAHEKGIIHRDLKPENIFITRDGRLKILDFGLARVTGPAMSDSIAADAPTTPAGTDPGAVLGTVGYMSPEQVRGKPADVRSDVFAYGTVLYEMLTGKRAFRRESAVETMNAILKEDPPELSSVDETMPPALERIVSHCLEKQPEARFQSARDIGFSLATLSELSSSRTGTIAARRSSKKKPWVVGAAILIAALALLAGGYLLARSTTSHEPPSYKRLTFRHGEVFWARFSPVDNAVVYAMGTESGTETYSISPGSTDARQLGLHNHAGLSISKTGELALQLNPVMGRAFTFSGTLATTPLAGGALRELADDVHWADWAPDGRELAIVRAEKNATDRIEYPIGTVIYRSAGWIDYPRFSPDGSQIAFFEHPEIGSDSGSVVVIDSTGKNRRVLTRHWSTARGLAWSKKDDEIWFTAAPTGGLRVLYGVSTDGDLRMINRVPSPLVLEDVDANGRALLTQYSERMGVVIRPAGADREKEYSWFDWTLVRDISLDGSTIVFDETGESAGDNGHTYIRATDGSAAIRIGTGVSATLSPDGKFVVMKQRQSGLFLAPIRAGKPRLIANDFVRGDLHPDGKRVVALTFNEKDGGQIFIADLDGNRRTAISPKGVAGRFLVLSPDGKWVAAFANGTVTLFSTEGGEPRPLRSTGARTAVAGWSADSRDLFVFERGDEGPIVVNRIDIGSGQSVPALTISGDAIPSNGSMTGVLVAGDGKSYAYSYRQGESTLVLAEGLD